MLDKQSKKVLKAVIKNIDELWNTKCPILLEKHIPQYNAEEIENSLMYLDELGYISCLRAEATVWRIALNYEGEKYFEFALIEFFDFFKKSIITPIIVATLTTLLINFLTKQL